MPPEIEPNPTRRGQRDADLAERMLSNSTPDNEDNMTDDYDGLTDVAFIGLLPGDLVVGKVAVCGSTPDGKEAWFTWGVQSRVGDDESEVMAANRVANIINTRVLDMADDMMARLVERREEVINRPRGRIPNRQSNDDD